MVDSINMATLIFGHSITYGAADPEGGWVDYLRKYYDSLSDDVQEREIVYNLGISGDTSLGIIKRFDTEVEARLLDEEPHTIIFAMIGGNDSMFFPAENTFRTPEGEFRKNIETLLEKAKKYTDSIYVIEGSPVDDEKLNPIPWYPEAIYKNEYRHKYDQITEEICKSHNVGFIKIYDHFMSQDYKKLLADGIHPTKEGHELIFEIVKDYLAKN